MTNRIEAVSKLKAKRIYIIERVCLLCISEVFKKKTDRLLGIPNLIKALCYYVRMSIQTALELSLDSKLLNHFNKSMSEEMQMNANLAKLHF